MSRKPLDRFGETLMVHVRDEAIGDWEMILSGGMKDAGSQRIREELKKVALSAAQVEVLLDLVPKIVDTTLHHLLWTLEQATFIDVSVKADGERVCSIKDESDGLAGELYNWGPRFSKKPFETP